MKTDTFGNMKMFVNFLVIYFMLPLCVYSVDQSGGVGNVFQKIWQQNANNMNQMIRGSQIMSENQMVGEFSPCIIKFPGNGLASQLSYGNQFGFKPGTAIGKRSVEQTEKCPCPSVDAKGCPTCVCSHAGSLSLKGENHRKQTTSITHSQSTISPKVSNITVTTKQSSVLTTLTSGMVHYTGMVLFATTKPTTEHRNEIHATIAADVKSNHDQEKTWNNTPENTSGVIDELSERSENVNIYIGTMAGLAVVLCVVVILSIGFFYKWRKAVGNLKHEQNELYFAEKSFRLTLEKQPGRHSNESSNSARTISTCSSIHPLCSEDSLDSVFTVDTRNSSDVNMTRVISSGPSENRPLTPSAPLNTTGTNIFQYPPDTYHHDYLELM